MPKLGGGAETQGGRRGCGAMAGAWWDQDRGPGGLWCFTVRSLKAKVNRDVIDSLISVIKNVGCVQFHPYN